MVLFTATADGTSWSTQLFCTNEPSLRKMLAYLVFSLAYTSTLTKEAK
jgi:hypothetical protein